MSFVLLSRLYSSLRWSPTSEKELEEVENKLLSGKYDQGMEQLFDKNPNIHRKY